MTQISENLPDSLQELKIDAGNDGVKVLGDEVPVAKKKIIIRRMLHIAVIARAS